MKKLRTHLCQVDPALLHPADRLVLNDVDPNALQCALTHLPPATRAQTPRSSGNVLRTAAHLAGDRGPVDLVLAVGLVDYLEERVEAAVGRTQDGAVVVVAAFPFGEHGEGGDGAVAAGWPARRRGARRPREGGSNGGRAMRAS